MMETDALLDEREERSGANGGGIEGNNNCLKQPVLLLRVLRSTDFYANNNTCFFAKFIVHKIYRAGRTGKQWPVDRTDGEMFAAEPGECCGEERRSGQVGG